MRFRRIRGVKRSVFAENAERNGAFSAKTRYSRKSGYVLVFNTYLIKILEILGLGLVYYWMMPKNCEKRTIKSRACVPLSLKASHRRGVGKNQLKITASLPLRLIQLSAKPFTLDIPLKIRINNVHIVQPKCLPERKIFSVFLVFIMYVSKAIPPPKK